MDNRIAFLENSLVLLLLNPNLYEMLQASLLEEIRRCRSVAGDEIYAHILTTRKEELVGPDEINGAVLRTQLSAIGRKLSCYKRFGHLND